MLAARAAQLSNSKNPELSKLGSAYQAIAASIPEAIKLSSRISPQQLKIPLNQEFGGLLAMVRDPPDEIRLNGAESPVIRVLGPFQEDLDELRKKWNDWLQIKRTSKCLLARGSGATRRRSASILRAYQPSRSMTSWETGRR
jgi:hypothetical protein